ncbi:MAG TPA: hypothetical protein PLS42_06175 [Candidatus Competibacter denitrificans]|uniref:hypothetical protein n=1 Tax=Candidatus Competibacter denitrificans TaxID=1400862 RepID=UPI001494ACD2|nr:hypothetical protein [Candidatus Competibacter denitrificans]HRC69238.1 hypothetical protein [Candidatus Competibacter denitrificans]
MQWKNDPADSILLNRSFSPAMQWLNCELMDADPCHASFLEVGSDGIKKALW